MTQDHGASADADQALVASLPEPVPVSALPGDGPSREPFMPIAEVTDDMLIDTGKEIVTWGELRRRDSDRNPEGGNAVPSRSDESAGRDSGIAKVDTP